MNDEESADFAKDRARIATKLRQVTTLELKLRKAEIRSKFANGKGSDLLRLESQILERMITDRERS